MDKKEARKILNVNKETSRNDIERKYTIFLKRHRAAGRPIESEEDMDEADFSAANLKQSQPVGSEKPSASAEYSFDQITQAYNVLMGYEVAVKEELPGRMSPLFKKAGIDEKKAKNFFYYYKYYIVAAIILIVAVVFLVKGCVNRVDPDFNIAFIGKFVYMDASEKLKESIKKNIPEIVEPNIDGAYLADNDIGEQQYSMMMKATVLFAAGDIDVFILDKASFERYAKQGAFLSLDDIGPKLGVDMEKNKEYRVSVVDRDDLVEIDGFESETVEDKTLEEPASNDKNIPANEHLFGIEVTDSKELKEAGILGEDMIAAIFVGCSQPVKAEKFMQFLMR